MDVLDLTATPVLEEAFEADAGDIHLWDLRDVAVVTIEGILYIVVSDKDGKALISVHTINGKRRWSQLRLEQHPWSMATLADGTMAVTVPLKKEIIVVNVNPELKLSKTLKTLKDYWGLDVLDESSLVASSSIDSPPSVDILDMEGRVLRSLQQLPGPQSFFQRPWFVNVTRKGNILVSDFNGVSVTCLTPMGNVMFTYKPSDLPNRRIPYGITTTSTGDILVAEYRNCKIALLSESGEFVRYILTQENGIQNPFGLCVEGNKLYIANGSGDRPIQVFRFAK